jgi:hypothetical protein
MTAAGLATLAVTWWVGPIDKAAATELPRVAPLVFAARGIVPIGYAAFAFALGVTVRMLVRRTVPAMAITLAIFVAGQIAMPMLVRPHLLPPARSTFEITESNLDGFHIGPDDTLEVWSGDAGPAGAWVLSSDTIDASGDAVDTISVSASSGPCVPPTGALDKERAREQITKCLAEIERLGYRQEATYHPASRFWPFQWLETGIYLALALGLAGLCFRRLRRPLS